MKPLFNPSNTRWKNRLLPSTEMAMADSTTRTRMRIPKFLSRLPPKFSSHPKPLSTCSLTFWTVLMVDSSVAEVRLADALVVAELVRRAGHHCLARLKDVRPVGDVQSEVGVLLDDQHRHALCLVQLIEALEQALHDDRREPERRFVEQ